MERVDIQKKKIVRDKCHNDKIKRRQNTQTAVKPLGLISFRIWVVLLVQTQDKDVKPGTIQSPMTYNTHRQLQILCYEIPKDQYWSVLTHETQHRLIWDHTITICGTVMKSIRYLRRFHVLPKYHIFQISDRNGRNDLTDLKEVRNFWIHPQKPPYQNLINLYR